MKKITILLIVMAFTLSCADNKKNDSEESKTLTEEKRATEINNQGTQNYAVVFK